MKKLKGKVKTKNMQIFEILAMSAFMLATGFAIFSLSRTMSDIKTETISHTPEAILASAGVGGDENVYLSVAYYDQKADECVDLYNSDVRKDLYNRQFEWSKCGYQTKKIEKGLVADELDDEYLPVARAGELTSNRGLNFDRWFNLVDGKSSGYTGALKMDYKEDGAVFSFHQRNFYPLDEVDFSAGDYVNDDGHNHLFTMNFAVPFTAMANGNESFEITADDDTFVFVGDRLVLDMGGVHEPTTGSFAINDKGMIFAAVGQEQFTYSGVTINAGDNSLVRIFHADRDSAESVFGIKLSGMNLSITETKLADRQDEGVQIAYDPTDPTYVAPLGESSVVEPNKTKDYIVIATIEGVMVIVFAVLMSIAVRGMVKRKLAEK